MQAREVILALVLVLSAAELSSAMPEVQISDIIGNPMRYRDVRVKISGQVTKVEPDPLAPNSVVYILQDERNQVIRVKSLVAPELDSHITVVGAVAQDSEAAKPYIIELKHTEAGIPLSWLLGAGGVLIILAGVLIYMILFPKPVKKKQQKSYQLSKEPEVERRPVITQVYRDDPVALLVAISGPYKGETFKLFKGINTIGRDDNMTVQLVDDPTVSRNHARIDATNGGLIISNESSTNPTAVSGQEVTEKELSDGDIIQIGSTRLKVSFITGN
ncbi:MAG TPA: FHA domain-containing protein [Armatimonadota bacterium]|nr:FHA domain-containing protein [Armatimonadota bacterium]HPP74048.1 FHA domain-containing protein [Armatimonadota bacterium]